MSDAATGGDLRVLLVEDDEELRLTTRLILERHGFRVTVAADGMEGWEAANADLPDLALVDVVMPRMDGITLTKRLKTELDLPVILLTARDLPHDEILGLDAGADDYVTKPFDGDVLAARLRAVARRVRPETSHRELVGPLEIDRRGMTVRRDGEELPLTATEFKLLLALVDHAGAVLSRTQLLRLVWESDDWGQGRTVDVAIQRLRLKVGPDVIDTVRGAGYKLIRGSRG